MRDEFWNELTRCVDGLSTRNYVVVLGDLNARVGDGELEGVVGKYEVSGGKRLLDVCGARVGNRKSFYPLSALPEHIHSTILFVRQSYL